MNLKALKVLEYSKIKEMWSEEAVSSMVKEKIMGMEPYLDAYIIKDELRSTTEGVDLIVNKGPLPIYSIYDVSRDITLVKKGGVLSMRSLLSISYNLKTCGRVRTFLKGKLPDIHGLIAMSEVLDPVLNLSEEIDRCILSEDEMADSASRELARIRREIIRTGEEIKYKLKKWQPLKQVALYCKREL